MFKARLTNGQEIIVDDYREAYHWLRDNTPVRAAAAHPPRAPLTRRGRARRRRTRA
eukprot:SAG11_NODE_16414_length_548_cov_0.579065_2_plen_56_part_00